MDFKIFDTLLEPVFVISDEKKIVYCNEPAATICDMSIRKLSKGIRFDEVLQFVEPIDFLKNIKEITDASPYIETAFTASSGKAGKAQLTCQPVPNVASAWIVFFRDVTLEETLQKKYRAELEQVQHYSKNLEKMVEERTATIRKLNQTMSALLDSLNQGFFIFNTEGTCLEVASKSCETTIEGNPAGKPIWEVLRVSNNEIPGFKKWMTTIFSEMLPFEDLSPLGPETFPHGHGKHIKLEYYPVRSAENVMEAIVVVASDITNLIAAQKEAEVERANAKMILSLVKNRRQVAGFMREAREILTSLERELRLGMQMNQEAVFRYLHTLKGGAASFSIKAMADTCHEAETLMSSFKWEPMTEKDVQKIKDLCFQVEERFLMFQMDNVEIIGDEAQLRERWVEAPVSHFFDFREHQMKHDRALSETFTEAFVMEPIRASFEHFHEVVKNVATSEGKSVAPLEFVGGELRVLPEPYENLFSTMIHAFRNAVDHGIELPEVRVESGKPSEGKIAIYFSKEVIKNSEFLVLEVVDDGGGISPEKIRSKLKEKGIDTSSESDSEVIQHIFDSQFSTKEQVTETSGRGVGMDAIAHAARILGGHTLVSSTLGKGSRLRIEVPFLRERPNAIAVKKAA